MDWIFLKEAMGRFTFNADSSLELINPYENGAKMFARVESDSLNSGHDLKTAMGIIDGFGKNQKRHLEAFLKTIQGASSRNPKKWARSKFKATDFRQSFEMGTVRSTMVIDVDTPKDEEPGDKDFIFMVKFMGIGQGSYFKKFKVK